MIKKYRKDHGVSLLNALLHLSEIITLTFTL